MNDFMSVPPHSDLKTADLAAALGQMSQVLLAAQTASSAVDLVGLLAVETIPHTIGAGVTLIDANGRRSRAATHSLVEKADLLQYELGAGPCLTAWRDKTAVRIDDVEAEARWPQWSAAVASLGIRAMVSVPLISGAGSLGAIKVYSNQMAAYNAETERILAMFADQASVLLANTQTVADARLLSGKLTGALDERDVIAQATGILIARGAVDVEAGFIVLLGIAQRRKTTIHDVARRIVDTVTAQNKVNPVPVDDPAVHHR